MLHLYFSIKSQTNKQTNTPQTQLSQTEDGRLELMQHSRQMEKRTYTMSVEIERLKRELGDLKQKNSLLEDRCNKTDLDRNELSIKYRVCALWLVYLPINTNNAPVILYLAVDVIEICDLENRLVIMAIQYF